MQKRSSSRRVTERRRDIATETKSVAPSSTSVAQSSHAALYFHDVPPELIRRAAQRYTGGHKKYGVLHTNLNWRIGLDDTMYVADRFNHLVTHLLEFMEHGNEKDDNLGAMAWSIGFLMEVERHAPHVLADVIGHSKLFGKSASAYLAKVKKEAVKLNENHSS